VSSFANREGATHAGVRFLIRSATAEDSEAIVALSDSVASEERWIAAQPGETTPIEETLRLAELLSRGGLSLLVEVDGEIAGHLIARLEGEDFGRVGLIVGAAWRRQGLGESLMDAAITWGRGKGITKLVLSVFSDNQPAIALYRKLGFVEEGSEPDRYKVGGVMKDVIRMGLELHE
jgi:ribosomal protein S18 acetylase RimI-like enzyme